MMKKPLIHFITNYVTMNDVANVCLAVGGRPIMAEAIEELEDIITKASGVVLNLGTINQERMIVIEKAALISKSINKLVLLDPVGCGASRYRLKNTLNLLKQCDISILKCNFQEANALVNETIIDEAIGVDSHDYNEKEKTQLGQKLYNKFSKGNRTFYVIITGKSDIIISDNHVHTETGGACLQKEITGTGCMLNAIIMTYVIQSPENIFQGIINGLKCMNKSSERAISKLKNKRYTASYKCFLMDELSAYKKIIYLVTDEKIDFEKELLPKTVEALKHGVNILQYRAKNKSNDEKLKEALSLKKLAQEYGATFIINDDVNLAESVNADGVHLGNSDMDVTKAREILGYDAVVGATAKTVEQAQKAEEEGADYLGVGAVFPSPTKKDAIRISGNTLSEIREAVNIPIYGIGGITPEKLTMDITSNIDGVAVVSCIYNCDLSGSKETVAECIKELKYKLDGVCITK